MKSINLKSSSKIFVLIVSVLFIFSCNSKSPKENIELSGVNLAEDYKAVNQPEISESGEMTDKPAIKELKIIRSANVRFKVGNVKKATEEISEMVETFRGYVADQRFQNTNYSIENRFTIKVPQEKFGILLDTLQSVADFVDHQNMTSQDVTEEYIDLQSRLKTKLEIKERYEDILRKKAQTVNDILAAEEKLGYIQEEIEAAQGRIKYLTGKVSFSTITVDLYETVNYKEEPVSYKRNFSSKMKSGLVFGFELIETLVIGLIYLWPLILLGLALFIWLRIRNKK